jgi:site-specific recombinase
MVDYGLLGAIGWALLLGITAGVGALIYLQRVDDSADLAGPTAVGIGSFMMSMYTISFVGNIPLLMTFLAIVCATRHRLVREGKLLPMAQVFERAMNRKQPIEAAGARS